MAIQLESKSHHNTKANRIRQDTSQIDDYEKKLLAPVIGDSYITKEGVKKEIKSADDLKDANSLIKHSGTVIIKSHAKSDEGTTVYYQNHQGIDMLMDAGYHKNKEDTLLTHFTDSDKDDNNNIDFSVSARKRFQHDYLHDVSTAQKPAVQASIDKFNGLNTDQITFAQAKSTLRTLAKAQKNGELTTQYMLDRFNKLDEKIAEGSTLTDDERNEYQAYGRVLFDSKAFNRIDKNKDGTFSKDELSSHKSENSI
ncbi:hypothetical protein [Actimicrobium sp. CCI2.3]|uniref:hypothetical protein n=1 Tax=Actimicrobium sp. CCI2.3 TaxID=3048616 RepID=UPI002AB581D0|nr:hypothetical protein [Actimicrobium sp. CCI2.3]MDY7575491.1 hypothetical protein [Actimicrobium sp. CCI2.3]MEB0023727.1 hypothetical protein [Actimicrobium sp. CCI2.3]